MATYTDKSGISPAHLKAATIYTKKASEWGVKSRDDVRCGVARGMVPRLAKQR